MVQKNINSKLALGVPGEFYDKTAPKRCWSYRLNGAAGASTYAENFVTFAANPLDGETITLGATVYTFKNTMAAAGDVQIGVEVGDTINSFVKTVNGTGVAGVDYFTDTTVPNASARAQVDGALGVKVTAKAAGTAGNAIVFTASGGSLIIEAPGGTLVGGAAGVSIPPTVARVFTFTDDPNVVALGGTGAFAGILVGPKQYANYLNLRPTMQIPEGVNGDIAYMGDIVVTCAHATSPNYIGIYNTTTGEIGANPSATGIPTGWAAIPNSRYILFTAVAGEQAVLQLTN